MAKTDSENTKPEATVLETVTLTLSAAQRSSATPTFKPDLRLSLREPVTYETVPYNVFHGDINQDKTSWLGRSHILLGPVT